MSIWDRMFNFDNYGELLALLQNSIIAGALLGLIGGLIGVFVMMRDLTFAVHASANYPSPARHLRCWSASMWSSVRSWAR